MPLGAAVGVAVLSGAPVGAAVPQATARVTEHAVATTTPTTVAVPGSADDPADFYGLGAALIGIVVAIVVTRFLFRRRGPGR